MEDTTKKEILEAIGSLSDRLDLTDKKLDENSNSLSDLNGSFNSLSDRLDRTETELLEAIHILADDTNRQFRDVKTSLSRVENTMVTKDYLDDKLATQHSDIVKFVRKRVPEWAKAGNA